MKVPFATNYNGYTEMQSYPDTYRKDFKWFDMEPFESEMIIEDYERGCSAARFVARDTESGIRYPVFMSDMMALIPFMVKGKVAGTWAASKRGANYGIKLIAAKAECESTDGTS